MLDAEEYARLLKHAEGHTKGIQAMAYFTGMRRGEILGLTLDRVDLQRRMICLEAKHTKDKEPRKVPICAPLFRMLQDMPGKVAESGKARHVFTFKGKPPQGDIRAGIREACKLAGIEYGRNKREGFTLHDLRHAFTTNLRRAGVPEREIMAITGHSSRSSLTDIRRSMKRTCTGQWTGRRCFPISVAFSVARAKKKARPKPGFLL